MPHEDFTVPHAIGITSDPTESLHPAMQALGRSQKLESLLQQILGGKEETEVPLLDTPGRSEYRWTDDVYLLSFSRHCARDRAATEKSPP